MRTARQFVFLRPALVVFVAATGLKTLSGCGNDALSVPRITARPVAAVVADINRKETKNADPKRPDADVGSKAGGTFTGTIVTDAKSSTGKPEGFVPKEYCMNPMVSKQIVDESLIVGPNGGLKNVFVYLRKPPAGYQPRKIGKSVSFTNLNCMFKPHAMIVRVGQPVVVTNDDDVAHTATIGLLFGTPVSTNIPFKGRFKFNYDAAQPIPATVTCAIHGWMKAYQLPLDHDLVAMTDENGKFTIENIPPGTHKFTVWHEKAGYLEKLGITVVIRSGKTVTKHLKYSAAKFVGLNGLSSAAVTMRLK